MKILFCSPEAAPYAKTGGLADVSGALPGALRELGADCRVVMPLYQSVKKAVTGLKHVTDISFLSGQGVSQGRVYADGPVHFIENDAYFNRDGIYAYANRDFPDNLERFAFFSRACVELAITLGDVDVIHCNDWQTGLIPAYLHALEARGIKSCYTIHNLAYQGIFDALLWPLLFLPYDFFRPDLMEFFGNINIMKAGIVFADQVTTVSPSYASEIKTPDFGAGLDGLLRAVSFKLSGIANGIDTVVWDPATDPLIPYSFDKDRLEGKARCKLELQKRFSLEQKPGSPLFGLIGRLVDQKGIDLVIKIMEDLLSRDAQVVVLGTGEKWHEENLRRMAGRHPTSLAAFIGFDEALAHVIEAGSDFFLMPSRFEPCGLNQMISMRYGTIPIVTGVGGLRDTVTCLGEGDTPQGVRVKLPAPVQLLRAVDEACALYREDPAAFRRLQKNAMDKNVDWTQSALQYYDMYSKMLNSRESER